MDRQHLHVQPHRRRHGLGHRVGNVVELQIQENGTAPARICRTTSGPALVNNSLPILNAPTTGPSCFARAKAASAVGTSKAAMIGLRMTGLNPNPPPATRRNQDSPTHSPRFRVAFPCFPHAFPTHSTGFQQAFNRLSTRFQYAFHYLGGAPPHGSSSAFNILPSAFLPSPFPPSAILPLPSSPSRGALVEPCTRCVQALYEPCTGPVQALSSPCSPDVHALYTPCTALYWPCTSLRPHSKFRVQGSRFKVRGSAPPAICHPPSSVAALPRWVLCGQRRLWVALRCGRLESSLQAVADFRPVLMDSLADSGAGAGWHGVGMAI